MKMSLKSLVLTPDQQAVLIALREDPDAPGWAQPMAVTVTGVTDETLLGKAVCLFIDTADIFRLRVDPQNPDSRVWIAEVSDRFTDIEFLDFTDLPPEEQELELAWMILDEAEHGWSLAHDWPVRVNSVRLDTHQWAVVFFFHRLVYQRSAKNRYMAAFSAALQAATDPAGKAAVLSFPSWFEYIRHACPSLDVVSDSDLDRDKACAVPAPAEAGKAVQNLGPVQPALITLTKNYELEISHLLLAGILLWLHLFCRITSSDLEVDFSNDLGDPERNPLGPLTFRKKISTFVTDEMSLLDLARQIKRVWTETSRHIAVPNECVPDEPDSEPEARIRFFCDFFDNAPQFAAPIRVTGSHADILSTAYDMELIFSDLNAELTLTMVYDQQLMGFDEAQNLARELGGVLKALSHGLDGSTADLKLTLAASRRAEPVPLPVPPRIPKNDTATPEAQFARIAALYPDQIAVKTATDHITYQDLDVRSSQLAMTISEKIGSHSRVGILLDQGISAVIAILAILKSGNAYVPLDCHAPAQRIHFMVTDAELSLVILDRDTEAVWQKVAFPDLPMLLMDGLNRLSGKTSALSPTNPGEDAYIIYTSGTTGQPKGVVQTRENVCHFARTYAEYLKISPDDSLTLMSAYLFDAAVLDIFTALLTGAKLVMFDLKKEDLSAVSLRLHRDRVTVYHSTASVFRYWIDSMDPSERFPIIRYVVLGGEPSFRNDLVRFQTHFAPCSVLVNLYGLSELTIGTMGFFNQDTEVDTKWLPIGGPIADVSVTVVDEHGVPTPGSGQMVFSGSCLARGYWRRPDLSVEKFFDIPDGTRSFFTGDIGEITDAGKLIHLGRKDFQIKIRGYRVEPGEIEACITTHDQVDKCVVHPVTGKDGESVLVAFIILAPGGGDISASALGRFLEPYLPGYMIPQKVITMSSFPRTVSGKIHRQSLEKMVLEN